MGSLLFLVTAGRLVSEDFDFCACKDFEVFFVKIHPLPGEKQALCGHGEEVD